MPTEGVQGGAHGTPEIIPECASDKNIFFTLSSSEFHNFHSDDKEENEEVFSNSCCCFPGEGVLELDLILSKLVLDTLGKRILSRVFFSLGLLLLPFFGA